MKKQRRTIAQQLGQRGGEQTKARHGRQHFVRISALGVAARQRTAQRSRPSADAPAAGKNAAG